jgi:hypothetical protein
LRFTAIFPGFFALNAILEGDPADGGVIFCEKQSPDEIRVIDTENWDGGKGWWPMG